MRAIVARQRVLLPTLGICWAPEFFEGETEIPSFIPFVSAMLDGNETASVWFRGGSEDLLISAFNKERTILFLSESEAKTMFHIALGIIQQHLEPVTFSTVNTRHEEHKRLLAVAYTDAIAEGVRKTDISSHLELSNVLIGSRVPGKKGLRAFVTARRLHTKKQEYTKVVLDITPDFIQDLVDCYVSIGGTVIINKTARSQSAPALVVRPFIASADL